MSIVSLRIVQATRIWNRTSPWCWWLSLTTWTFTLDFNDYLAAKANIAVPKPRTEGVVYNSQNEFSSSIADASLAQKRNIHALRLYNFCDLLAREACRQCVRSDSGGKSICRTLDDDKEGFKGSLRLPHRLKFVENTVWNIMMTAFRPPAVIAALQLLLVEPKILILGGPVKRRRLPELAKEIARQT